jgi:hypothetical protein
MATKYRMELVRLVVEKDVHLNQGVILRPGAYEGRVRQDAKGDDWLPPVYLLELTADEIMQMGGRARTGPSERIRYHQICEVRQVARH